MEGVDCEVCLQISPSKLNLESFFNVIKTGQVPKRRKTLLTWGIAPPRSLCRSGGVSHLSAGASHTAPQLPHI